MKKSINCYVKAAAVTVGLYLGTAAVSAQGGGAGAGRAGGAGGGGGGAGGGGRGGNGAFQSASRVAIVADDRSNSLIITAPDEVMVQIQTLINDLDTQVDDLVEMRVVPLKNADPTEMANTIANLYQSTGTTTGARGATGARGGNTGARGATANGGNRALVQAQVLAVADPRTASVIVSASKDMMEDILGVIKVLDDSDRSKQTAVIFKLKNADTIDVEPVVQAMFGSNTRSTANTANNALVNRTTFESAGQQTINSLTSASTGGTGGQ